MIRRVDELLGGTIHAADGEIGHVRDVYFDDQRWMVRDFVVDTRHWLSGRHVLLSPAVVRASKSPDHSLHVTLSREQIRHSPDAETHQPVGRQHVPLFRECYTLPYSWALGGFFRVTALPTRNDRRDPHLRSIRLIKGYRVEAIDGTVGPLADFLIDDTFWVFCYVMVTTRRWWPGKHVLVPAGCIGWVSWIERTVYIDLPLQTILNSPDCDVSRPLTAQDITRLAAFYEQPPGPVGAAPPQSSASQTSCSFWLE